MSMMESVPPACPEPAAHNATRLWPRMSCAASRSSSMEYSLVTWPVFASRSDMVGLLSIPCGGRETPATAGLETGATQSHVRPDPRFDTLERFHQVLHGIGDTEAQITLAIGAKRGAGKRGHSSPFKQRIGQGFRGPPRARDVRKDIKCALGHARAEAPDAVEAFDKSSAAPLEFQTHRIHGAL